MRFFWIIVIVLLFAAVICWVRDSATGFHVIQALPLLGGKEPSILWDGATVVMLLIVIWGVRRLGQKD